MATPKAKRTTKPKSNGTLTHAADSAEIVQEITPHVEIMSVQKLNPEAKLKAEIARFELARTWIAAKKAEYADLKIADARDKIGYDIVYKAWQEVRNKRLAVQKKHTEIKSDYLVITRGIDQEKNDLVSLLEEIENPLKAEIDRIENEKLAAAREKERLEQEKLQGRVTDLLANGMQFNGSFYVIGDTISVDVVTLKNMDDNTYERFLSRVKNESAAILEAKAKKEREEAEERQRLQQQKEDNDRAAENLRKEREDLERQQAAAREVRTKTRAKLLQAMGMVYDFAGKRFHYSTPDCGHIEIAHSVVTDGTDEDFATASDAAEFQIEKLSQQQKEKDDARKAKEIQEQKRLAQVREREAILRERFGIIWNENIGEYCRESACAEVGSIRVSRGLVADANSDQWIKTLQDVTVLYSDVVRSEQNAKTKAEQEKEAQRLAALSDVQRVREWLLKLVSTVEDVPTLDNKAIDSLLRNFHHDIHLQTAQFSERLREFEK